MFLTAVISLFYSCWLLTFRFLVSSSYAYGSMGCPPRIPGNVSIIFEVELLGFTESSALDDYKELSDQEKRDLPFEKYLLALSCLFISSCSVFMLIFFPGYWLLLKLARMTEMISLHVKTLPKPYESKKYSFLMCLVT